MPTKFVMFATVLCFIGMVASADAATNSGKANSKARKNWCEKRLQNCMKNAANACKGYEGGAVGSNLAQSHYTCIVTYQASCMDSSKSCITDLASQPDLGAINPNLPDQNAPVEPTPPTYNPRLPRAGVGGVGGMIAVPRGVEGAPATPAPTEEKDTTSAPK